VRTYYIDLIDIVLQIMEQSSELQVQMLQEQNELLREQNRLLMALLSLTPENMKQLLGGVADNAAPDSNAEEYEAVFQAFEAIQENDEAHREQVQKELQAWQGKPVSKSLVRRLQAFLKIHEWGIQTDEKIPAAPVWQADKGSPRGGYMRLSYTDPTLKRGVQTKSFSYFPSIIIVPRPDARKRREA
jgi:hypothetical protein